MQERSKNNILLLELLLLLKALVVFVPAAGEYMPSIINAFVVIGIYVALINSAGMLFIIKTFFQFIPLYLISIFNALWGYSHASLPLFLYGVIQWSLWPIAITFLMKRNNVKVASRLYYISLILVLITSVTTIIGNISIPNASRYLAAIWSEDAETAHYYRRLNIGGFEFVYLIVLLISILIYTIKRHNVGMLPKILAITAIIISFMTILESQYTIALIFAVISLILFVMPRVFSTKAMAMCILGGITFAYFSSATVSLFLIRFADTTEKTSISTRVYEVTDVLMGRGAEGDMENRQYLMTKSWEAFKDNPFTGSSDVGGHSFVLDTMGHYGIIGIVLLLIVFVRLFQLCVKPYRNTAIYGYLLFAYIAQICLAILNTTIIFLYFFLFVPLVAIIFDNDKQSPLRKHVV